MVITISAANDDDGNLKIKKQTAENGKVLICSGCNRRKRVLYSFNGDDLCKDCSIGKVWWNIVEEGINEEDVDSLEVSDEHIMFTRRFMVIIPYITAVRALNELVQQGYDETIPMVGFKKFIDTYKVDHNEILRVLKKAQAISMYDDDQIIPGPFLRELEVLIGRGRILEAYLRLDGRISLVALGETNNNSRIRETLVSAVSNHCIDDKGNIITFELSEDDLEEARKRFNISSKSMMNHVHDIIEMGFFFKSGDYIRKPVRKRTGTDENGNPVFEERDVRVWQVKPSWVRIIAKVNQRFKERERFYEKSR